MYKGTIIKNSLRDTSILTKVKIKKTYQIDDWILYDVLITKEQIQGLSNYLADGPWYMHLWEPGNDEVVVVFKDKSFLIKFTDKSTWTDAITYGKSIGIPEVQLAFLID